MLNSWLKTLAICLPLRSPSTRGGPFQPGIAPTTRGPHSPRYPIPSPAPRAQVKGLTESIREDMGVPSDQRRDAGYSVTNTTRASQSEFRENWTKYVFDVG